MISPSKIQKGVLIMLEIALVITLCLITALVALYVSLQGDSPNTRDALKIRYRDHHTDNDTDPYDYLWS